MTTGERPGTVVFVPGFMQRGPSWARVARLLGPRYRSILLDSAATTFEGRRAEILAAAEPGAVAVGYSLGGRLVLHAALADPGRFAAVVVLGAGAGIEPEAARAERRAADEALADWMEGQPIETVVDHWERQPVFQAQPPGLVADQRAGRLSHDPRELATLLRSAGQGALAPVWSRLGELEMPVLTLAGAADDRYAAAAHRMAEALPRGQARLVPGAGHAAHLEAPELVAAALADFLDEHL